MKHKKCQGWLAVLELWLTQPFPLFFSFEDYQGHWSRTQNAHNDREDKKIIWFVIFTTNDVSFQISEFFICKNAVKDLSIMSYKSGSCHWTCVWSWKVNHRVWEVSLVKEQKAASKARTDRSPSEQNQSTPLASSSCPSGCRTGFVAGYCVT